MEERVKTRAPIYGLKRNIFRRDKQCESGVSDTKVNKSREREQYLSGQWCKHIFACFRLHSPHNINLHVHQRRASHLFALRGEIMTPTVASRCDAMESFDGTEISAIHAKNRRRLCLMVMKNFHSGKSALRAKRRNKGTHLITIKAYGMRARINVTTKLLFCFAIKKVSFDWNDFVRKLRADQSTVMTRSRFAFCISGSQFDCKHLISFNGASSAKQTHGRFYGF